MGQAAQLCEAIRKPRGRKQQTLGPPEGLWNPPRPKANPTMDDIYLDRGFPLKSAISRALQNFMLSGISGMSTCGEGLA